MSPSRFTYTRPARRFDAGFVVLSLLLGLVILVAFAAPIVITIGARA